MLNEVKLDEVRLVVFDKSKKASKKSRTKESKKDEGGQDHGQGFTHHLSWTGIFSSSSCIILRKSIFRSCVQPMASSTNPPQMPPLQP